MYCFAIISNSNELSLENLKHPVDGKKIPLFSLLFFPTKSSKRWQYVCKLYHPTRLTVQLGLLDKSEALDIYFLSILSSCVKNYFSQSKNSSEFSPSKLSSDWWKEN